MGLNPGSPPNDTKMVAPMSASFSDPDTTIKSKDSWHSSIMEEEKEIPFQEPTELNGVIAPMVELALDKEADSTVEPEQEQSSPVKTEVGHVPNSVDSPTSNVQVVEITKVDGAVGISIGGGFPMCPVLYICNIFKNTPADNQTELQVGDELVAINGESLAGVPPNRAAEIIRQSADVVKLSFISFHAPAEEGMEFRVEVGMKQLAIGMYDMFHQDVVKAFKLEEEVQRESDEMAEYVEAFQRTYDCHSRLPKFLGQYKAAVEDLAATHFQLARSCSLQANCIDDDQLLKLTETTAMAHQMCQQAAGMVSKAMSPFYDNVTTSADKVLQDYKLTLEKYYSLKRHHLALLLAINEMEGEEQRALERNIKLDRWQNGNLKYRRFLCYKIKVKRQLRVLEEDIGTKLALLQRTIGDSMSSSVWGLLEAMGYYGETVAKGFSSVVDIGNEQSS